MTDFPSGASGPPGPGWWQASDGHWYPPEQAPGYAAPPPPLPPPLPPGYAGAPPPGYGYGYAYPLQPTPGNNGYALASLISSCASVVVCGIGSILGVIFGHVALSQIKRTGEGGRGMAVAGLVVGYLGILVMIFLVIALIPLSDGDTDFQFDSMFRSWRT